jgi:hypothetical protein
VTAAGPRPDDEPAGADEPYDISEPYELTEEDYAERARRADKSSRGVLAAVLALEAIVVLLVPRTIAFTTGLGPVRLGVVIAVAVLLIAGAGLLRRPWGIGLGSALQVVFFATGILIATMFLVAALFIAVWIRVLVFRHEAVGTAGGLRMLLG